jgi:hypothetical protein
MEEADIGKIREAMKAGNSLPQPTPLAALRRVMEGLKLLIMAETRERARESL